MVTSTITTTTKLSPDPKYNTCGFISLGVFDWSSDERSKKL